MASYKCFSPLCETKTHRRQTRQPCRLNICWNIGWVEVVSEARCLCRTSLITRVRLWRSATSSFRKRQNIIFPPFSIDLSGSSVSFIFIWIKYIFFLLSSLIYFHFTRFSSDSLIKRFTRIQVQSLTFETNCLILLRSGWFDPAQKRYFPNF